MTRQLMMNGAVRAAGPIIEAVMSGKDDPGAQPGEMGENEGLA